MIHVSHWMVPDTHTVLVLELLFIKTVLIFLKFGHGLNLSAIEVETQAMALTAEGISNGLRGRTEDGSG